MVHCLCGQCMVHCLCGQCLVQCLCGQCMVHCLCGQCMMHCLCGQCMMHCLCGQCLVQCLCGQCLVHCLCDSHGALSVWMVKHCCAPMSLTSIFSLVNRFCNGTLNKHKASFEYSSSIPGPNSDIFFLDYAGSGAVHMLGGVGGLILALLCKWEDRKKRRERKKASVLKLSRRVDMFCLILTIYTVDQTC